MVGLLPGGAEPAVEGDVEGVQGGLPAVAPALSAAAGGVEADDGEVEVLQRGLLVREVPAGLDRSADLALSDSTALVVEMMVRISGSKARNGTNSAQAFSHSRTI